MNPTVKVEPMVNVIPDEQRKADTRFHLAPGQAHLLAAIRWMRQYQEVAPAEGSESDLTRGYPSPQNSGHTKGGGSG